MTTKKKPKSRMTHRRLRRHYPRGCPALSGEEKQLAHLLSKPLLAFKAGMVEHVSNCKRCQKEKAEGMFERAMESLIYGDGLTRR